MFVQTKVCFKFAGSIVQEKFNEGFACNNLKLAHGVIGNTPVFGTVIQGSSPCGPTKIPI